jgi:hypothetical protein
MKPIPHSWQQPTVARNTASDAPAEIQTAPVELPLNTDLTALLAQDDTLLATILERCRASGLYLVHDGRKIKISPIIEPGWRVIHEIDKDCLGKAAA